MNQIDTLYDKIVSNIKDNIKLESELTATIMRAIQYVQLNYISKHENGFCSKFYIPDKDIENLFAGFKDLSTDIIKKSFIHDWVVPEGVTAHMWKNEYYHKLLLVFYYGVRNNKEQLATNALKLLLYRLWNGRLSKLIQYCDPEIMAAAISELKDNRLKVKKFANPLDLVNEYLAPSIYQKYKEYVLRDSKDTKRVFEQCHHRIKQLFGSNPRKDLDTGVTKYQTGLQPSYYKAHANKSRIKTTDANEHITKDFNTESSIDNITTFITLSNKVEYKSEFINLVYNDVRGFKKQTISSILNKMHNIKYMNNIREIIELFFRIINKLDESILCSDRFFTLVKNNVISSKNSKNIDQLKSVTDLLLHEIFKSDNPPVDNYLSRSNNQRSQYRMVIFYGIAYNIRRSLCEFFNE